MSTGGAAAASPSRIHLDRGATWRLSEQLFLAAKQDPSGQEVSAANLYRQFGRLQPDWYEDQLKAVNGALTGERDLPGFAVRSVLDPEYGAVADGTTDCTAAFQAALDQVASEGGGTVIVPPVLNVSTQSYRLNGTVTIPAGVVLAGAGTRSIVRCRATDVQFDFATGLCRSGLRDLVLLGNDASPIGVCVSLVESQFVELQRLEIWDFEIAVDVSDGTPFSAYNRIDHCEINRSTVCGIRIHQSSNGVTIVGGRIFWTFDGANGGIAIDVQDARAVSIMGVAIEAYDIGLRVAGAACGSMTGSWMEKGANGAPGTDRHDFAIDGFEESEFFEGGFSFLGNHSTDTWPLAAGELAFDVRAYGAIGDGVVDDQPAIQAAINAAHDAGGGTVFLPRGDFVLGAPLDFYSDIAFVGSGRQATRLIYSGTDEAITSFTPGTRSYRWSIRDIRIEYTSALATGGIHLLDASECCIERVVVAGPGASGGGSAFIAESTINGYAVYNTFRKCLAINCDQGYDIIGPGSNDTHILDCRAGSAEIGVRIVDSNHILVDGCAIEGNDTAGVQIESTSNALADGCTITNNRFEGNDINVQIAGTPANVRALQMRGNHSVSVISADIDQVDSTTLPSISGNTGDGGNRLRLVSAQGTDPCFHLEGTLSGVRTMVLRSSNTGSGSPRVLTVSAGRAASHAISICSWNGTIDTEVASIDAGGAIIAVSSTLSGLMQAGSGSISGDLNFTGASSAVVLGDGTTSGNPQVRFRKADGNNQSFMVWWAGTSASGLRWLWQHDTSENLNLQVADGSGNLLAIIPFTMRYSATNGRTEARFSRISLDRGTTLVNGDFALSAALGNTATAVVAANSTAHRGQVTITPQGSGLAGGGTITLTYPEGTRFAAGWTMVVRNGGTDTLLTVPGVGFTVADTATTFVITLNAGVTPVGGNTLIFRWQMLG